MSKKTRKEVINMEEKNIIDAVPAKENETVEETPKKGFFAKVVDGAKEVGGKAVSGVKKHGKVAFGIGVAAVFVGAIVYENIRNKKDDEESDCSDIYTDQPYDWHDPEIEEETQGEPEVPFEEEKVEETEV